MKKTIRSSALLVLFLQAALSAAATDEPLAATADKLFAQWAGPAAPGCAVSVTQGGKPLLARAYGQADLEHATANTLDTVFEAGSISKQFTAAALLLLARDGKLSLSDDVRTYLPELPDLGHRITLDQLLMHTAGLRDWGSIVELGGWPRGTRAVTMEQALALTARQRALNFAPGSRYSYSNTGYVLAAFVVQRVTGRTLAEFTRERIFVPLGMTHTQWRDNFKRIVPRRAVAYRRGADGYEQDMPFEDVYGHGGLLSTVGDLQIWNEALARDRLGIAARLEQLPALPPGQVSEYGRGLSVMNYRGVRELSHDGATGGYRTWLGRFPEHGLSIALLCNAGDVNPGKLARAMAQAVLAPVQGAQLPTQPMPAAAPTFAGTFYNELSGAKVALAFEDGALAIAGGPALRPIGPSTFAVGTGTFAFADRDSFVARGAGGEPVRFRRLANAASSPAALNVYAGRYRNDEVMATYRVVAREGGLEFRLVDKPDYAYRLAPLGPDTFGGSDIVVRFKRDAKGGVVGAHVAAERLFEVRFHKLGRQAGR